MDDEKILNDEKDDSMYKKCYHLNAKALNDARKILENALEEINKLILDADRQVEQIIMESAEEV